MNADLLAAATGLPPYDAAKAVEALRAQFIAEKQSFIFETVLSDPVGDKVRFLAEAAKADYEVVLCFIGLSSPELSRDRVAMRVLRGGHDVPEQKLKDRYPRTLNNLRLAIQTLPHVLVFDNSEAAVPFQLIAEFDFGNVTSMRQPPPTWLNLQGPIPPSV